MPSRILHIAWLSCLVLALVLTPLSQAWAWTGLDDSAAGVAATAHCPEGSTDNHPAPAQDEAAVRCPYHCLTMGALLPAAPLPPPRLLAGEVFVEPPSSRIEYSLEVDLRPPID